MKLFHSNIFEDREVSSFGISTGTGLALETLFEVTSARIDSAREIPVDVNIDDYGVCYYNIFTLCRNLYSSTPLKNKHEVLDNGHLEDTLREEIDIINSLHLNSDSKFVLYIPDYSKDILRYSSNKNNSLGKEYLYYKTMYEKLKGFKSEDYEIVNKIPDFSKFKSLVMTHYMLDMLKFKNNTYLLESHTGKIKSRLELGNKYHSIGKRDLKHLPLSDMLLYLLGDKTLIQPCKIKVRIELYNISENSSWTPMTTRDKIKHYLNKEDIILDELKYF